MIFKNIHKWFISLALLVSVVSFSGFTAEKTVKQNVFTELIKTNRPITKSAVYYYRAILKVERPTNFSFKTYNFSMAQKPDFWDYADDIDTIKFLQKLTS